MRWYSNPAIRIRESVFPTPCLIRNTYYYADSVLGFITRKHFALGANCDPLFSGPVKYLVKYRIQRCVFFVYITSLRGQYLNTVVDAWGKGITVSKWLFVIGNYSEPGKVWEIQCTVQCVYCDNDKY